MKKDAFYFPHFANARHDRKLKRVQKELGLEGYAIYFQLLEVLREQLDFKYPFNDVDLLADEMGTSEPKIKAVICNYDLFTLDEDSNFFSIKQLYYLQPYIEKTQRARIAAKKRWDNVNNDANAMQMHSKCNADAMQVKEIKGKETKVKQIKVKVLPILFRDSIYNDIEVFSAAFIGTQYESANFNFYYEKVKNWSDSKNNKKIDWIATAKNWMADDMANNKFIDINFNPNAKRINQDRKLTYAEQQAAIRNSY
jgi:hypothetical protein